MAVKGVEIIANDQGNKTTPCIMCEHK